MTGKFLSFCAILLFPAFRLFAQEEFKPSGSPHAKIYFNYHSSFDGAVRGFDITRSYLGYEYKMSERFSADVTFDVGTPEVNFNDTLSATTSFELTAYLKIAELVYKAGDLELSAGMIGLRQFKVQEDHWGHRYLEESFQDFYDLGPSADMGAMAAYKFSDWFSADLTIRNGEGYKKLQSDNALNAGLGLSFIPLPGVTVRGYYDYMKEGSVHSTVAHFIGYLNEKISAGAEYNMQFNSKNREDHDLHGYSFYGSWQFFDQWQLFGRYDNIGSNTLEGSYENWNMGDDGSLTLAGIEYTPLDNIHIALNYRGWKPASGTDDSRDYIFVNFEYVF